MTTTLKRPYYLLLGTLAAAVPASASAQSATFTLTTQQTLTPQFAPNNIVAVWIEKPNGMFVRTLARWANVRKQYLLAWNTASTGSIVDAVTGATFTAHGTRTVSWDLKDVNKVTVAPGMYVVKMELADRNATMASQNNFASATFTVGANPVNMTMNIGRFNNVTINYNPQGVIDMAGPPPDLSTGGGGGDAGADAGTGTMAGGCSMTAAHSLPVGSGPGWRAVGMWLLLLAAGYSFLKRTSS